VTPWEFREGSRKTVIGLPRGEETSPRLAVSNEYRNVTDGQNCVINIAGASVLTRDKNYVCSSPLS